MNTRVVPTMHQWQVAEDMFNSRGCTHFASVRKIIEAFLAAAPPQPEPAERWFDGGIQINLHQAKEILGFFGGEDTDMTIKWLDKSQCESDDDSPPESGLRIWCSDYPEEGSMFLPEEPTNAAATQADPVKAEKVDAPSAAGGSTPPAASTAAPNTNFRNQIADAKARQAKGEGEPGDCELAHYDDKEPERRKTQRRVSTDKEIAELYAERDKDRRKNAAGQAGSSDQQRLEPSDDGPASAAPFYEHATTCPTYSGGTLCDCRPVPAAPSIRDEIATPECNAMLKELRLRSAAPASTLPIAKQCWNNNGLKWYAADDYVKLVDAAIVQEQQLAEKNTALHASAPSGCKCSDCYMDREPCPICYRVWWQKRHPHTSIVCADDSEVFAATQRAEKAEAELAELRRVKS